MKENVLQRSRLKNTNCSKLIDRCSFIHIISLRNVARSFVEKFESIGIHSGKSFYVIHSIAFMRSLRGLCRSERFDRIHCMYVSLRRISQYERLSLRGKQIWCIHTFEQSQRISQTLMLAYKSGNNNIGFYGTPVTSFSITILGDFQA